MSDDFDFSQQPPVLRRQVAIQVEQSPDNLQLHLRGISQAMRYQFSVEDFNGILQPLIRQKRSFDKVGRREKS